MVRFASHSHPGRVHDTNEDSIGCESAQGLWFVADGMGGHASGEVASNIVRDTLEGNAARPLSDAVLAAHAAIAERGNSGDERLRGMGSTVVAFVQRGDEGEVVWVGDSRAYLWRSGRLQRLTRDHSYVEMLRDSSGITEADIRVHRQRNLVTQTLGIGAPVPSSAHVDLRANDWLMLCSDGLHDELDDDEIAAQLRSGRAPDDTVIMLVDAALANGGRDNVSVVLIAFAGDDLTGTRSARPWFPAVLGVVCALVLGTVMFFWLK
jgi:serine/threonine protein phosphatase PrpC